MSHVLGFDPKRKTVSLPNDDDDRAYIAITADTHAGAAIDTYRDYLDPQYREAFDEWRGGYSNPSK